MSGAKRKQTHAYQVAMRRDVQQVVLATVDAESPRQAIELAEFYVFESDWRVEEHIGSHKPKVRLVDESAPTKPKRTRTRKEGK